MVYVCAVVSHVIKNRMLTIADNSVALADDESHIIRIVSPPQTVAASLASPASGWDM